MSFLIAIVLFVIVLGILDAGFPWPKPRSPQG